MLLSIILLNFNKPQLTIACLQSLYEHFKKEFDDNQLEIVLVDNASSDGSVEVLKSEIKKNNYAHCVLIENKTNDGFSKGANKGVAQAKGKYYLFLNNDTVVKDRGIWEMVHYMESHQEVSILGGKLSNPDGSEQPSVGKFYMPAQVTFLMLGLQKYDIIDKNPEQIAAVDWVKGGLLMIRSEVFKKLHGFDEKIFMYTEDMELCYRAKQNGYKTFFYPFVHVLHEETGSSNRAFAIVNIYTNLLYFYKKHRTHGEYLYLKSLLRTKAVALIGIGRLLRNSYLVQTYEKAFKVT
ncbi:MAG: glycosyltransferase family 2 protein [Candidatus Levyibacteriota bacterium]